MKPEKKAWTLLYYLSGNNDLAPEQFHCMKKAQSVLQDDQVTVAMQISLAKPRLVQMIRSEQTYDPWHWCASGRYLICHDQTKRLQPMGTVNMADPQSLLEFIQWGITSFPAQQYGLILGGHGYEFVGCMTDFSGKHPSIMGYGEMSKAIQYACEPLGVQFDFLLLDACHTNYLELLYELGHWNQPSIGYLVTHLMDAPLEGFPADRLIATVQQFGHHPNCLPLLQRLVWECEHPMCVYRLDSQLLNRIKLHYHETNQLEQTWLEQLIVCKPQGIQQDALLFTAATQTKPTASMQTDYRQMQFYRHDSPEETQSQAEMHPLTLSPQGLYACVSAMNPTATPETKQKIFRRLLKYKGWQMQE